MNSKLENAFHHAILLHTLKDAGPEVHKAILDKNVPEDELIKHLQGYASKMYNDMQSSASGKSAASDSKDDGKSTASRVRKMANDFDASQPAESASDDEKTASRAKKIGLLFKK